MNYYPHHIGDFNSATRHLTRIERSVYRDLIELYYDTERPLAADVMRLCRLVIAVSDEERTAVQQVLNEFFTESEQGWIHIRCDQEIAKYHGNKVAKSAAGKASAAARAKKKPEAPTPLEPPKTEGDPTGVQQPLNGCATNQEPEPEPEPRTKVDQKHMVADATAEFEIFYRLYPVKKSKAAALKSWLKQNTDRSLTSQIMQGLAAQVASSDWSKDRIQFIPHPSTWLNGQRWNDEVSNAGSRQTDRQGPRSAIDDVKHAQAERDSKAAADPAGQAVAQDDGALRPALDGEFRRVG